MLCHVTNHNQSYHVNCIISCSPWHLPHFQSPTGPTHSGLNTLASWRRDAYGFCSTTSGATYAGLPGGQFCRVNSPEEIRPATDVIRLGPIPMPKRYGGYVGFIFGAYIPCIFHVPSASQFAKEKMATEIESCPRNSMVNLCNFFCARWPEGSHDVDASANC